MIYFTRLNKIISVSIVLLVRTSFKAEANDTTLRVDPGNIGVRMDGHLILEIVDCMGLYECAKQCTDLTSCLSINYAFREQVCELNSANKSTVQPSEMVANSSFIYIDISSWPKRTIDRCSSKPCSGTERCVSRRDSNLCLSTDCPEPPESINGGNLTSGQNSIGSIRKYVCPSGYIVHGTSTITCSGSTWSLPSFTCVYVRNCMDLQACNPEYTDGHYWLYPVAYDSSPVKVFCYGLDGTTPSEYITDTYNQLESLEKGYRCFQLLWSGHDVYNNNYAKNGAYSSSKIRITYYNKIRINIQTMTVNESDTTFSTSTGGGTGTIPYGVASDCECESWCAPTLGEFKIDTTGTGLIVNDTLPWKAGGWYPLLRNFDRRAEGSIISGNCGGNCGICRPDGPMTLFLKPSEVLGPSEATMPLCT